MSDRGETWLGIDRRGKPLVVAGTVLGLGLGGFFDGIVVHQILQWHHMVSAVVDPTALGGLKLNVVADGFFHVATYVLTILGIVLLVRAWRAPDVPASRRGLFGSVILGWGLFNVVEGLIDHQILGLHHVWPAGPGPVLLWDLAFLAWGALFVVGGYAVVRGADALSPSTGTPSSDEERARDERAG